MNEKDEKRQKKVGPLASAVSQSAWRISDNH